MASGRKGFLWMDCFNGRKYSLTKNGKDVLAKRATSLESEELATHPVNVALLTSYVLLATGY